MQYFELCFFIVVHLLSFTFSNYENAHTPVVLSSVFQIFYKLSFTFFESENDRTDIQHNVKLLVVECLGARLSQLVAHSRTCKLFELFMLLGIYNFVNRMDLCYISSFTGFLLYMKPVECLYFSYLAPLFSITIL